MKTITFLKNDYIIVKRELGEYEMLQDLNNPHSIIIINYDTVGAVEEKTFYKITAIDIPAFELLWTDRASHTYTNLMKYFSPVN